MVRKNRGQKESEDYLMGVLLKDVVRRAIITIRRERLGFTVFEKIHGENKSKDKRRDLTTSADLAAQRLYIDVLKKSFPGYGIVAEEKNLSVNPKKGLVPERHFTVDPLDGTRAFERRQSDGVGTMVALVAGRDKNSHIEAAWVGDVNTQEMYGYSGEKSDVYRVHDFFEEEKLSVNTKKKLSEQYAISRVPIEKLTNPFRELFSRHLFRSYHITNGSIGTTMARLWKGEVGGYILSPNYIEPWDEAPIWGISKKLGFVFLKWDDKKNNFIEEDWQFRKKTYGRPYELLVIHKANVAALKKAIKSLKK